MHRLIQLSSILGRLIQFDVKWERVMKSLPAEAQEHMIRKMAYNSGRASISSDSGKLLTYMLHPSKIEDIPLARMRLKETIRDRYYRPIIGMRGSLIDRRAGDKFWTKHSMRKKVQPSYSRKNENPDDLIDIMHGGGKQHIESFLAGKHKGYSLEGDSRTGIQVHPLDRIGGIAAHKRSYHYSQGAASHYDRPAILEAKIKRKHLIRANNDYEAAVLNPKHLINPEVRSVRSDEDALPYLRPEEKEYTKPIRSGERVFSVARCLFDKVKEIQFKALYQPGERDEPPETIPKLEGVVDYTVQRHAAKRAGLHRDVRIGTPSHGLYSWATRKDLPGEGGKIGIHPQPVHPHSYLGWEGNIPEGYGAGDVKTEHVGKALVTRSTPEEVHATLADQKEHHRLAFVKTGKGWLLTRGNHPEPPTEAAKPKYKSVEPQKAHEALGSLEEGSIVQPKIDGALVYVTTKGNRPEVFSHRKSKHSGRNIIHTERVFHGRPTTDVPKEHQRTLIGELYGTRRGKAIEPQELGGILNTHLGESIAKQKARGVKLRIMPFDYANGKGEPYPERLQKVKESVKYLPKEVFHTPEEAKDSSAARRLFEKIRSGRHPLTKEGVIIHPPTGKMVKIKNTEEANVKITGTFPGEGKFQGSHGGFTYEGGQVGTGFTDETRADLHNYVGRMARIRHQGRYPSGAYRAPSFIGVEENK